MRCIAPFFHKELKIHLACGKCVSCLVNRRRKWTARMLMENEAHSDGVFVTLTYAEIPEDGCVSKRELQLFFKRLRKRTGLKLRYFACGEYGDEFHRPHYHAIIWGLPYPSVKTYETIDKCWGLGFVRCDSISPQRIEYTAGYVCKKISKLKEMKEKGLTKEFCLMSRKPALGSAYIEKLKEWAFLQNPYDVLSVFKFGNKLFPLDRLIREKLRSALLTEDEIRDVKNMTIENMQDALVDMVLETLGDEEAKRMDYFIRSDDDHFQYVNEFTTLANTAFYSSEQHKEDLMLVRRNQRRFVRKDL